MYLISAGYVANKSTGIPFCTESRKQKTPPERGFSGFCGWLPQNTLCYVNARSICDRRRTRNSGTDFDVFEYGMGFEFCPQNTVHAYSIYLYWGCSQWARGPQFYRRNEVLAETGGAVSALTLWSEHTVLRQSRCWQQAAERYASIVLLFTKRRRVWA